MRFPSNPDIRSAWSQALIQRFLITAGLTAVVLANLDDPPQIPATPLPYPSGPLGDVPSCGHKNRSDWKI